VILAGSDASPTFAGRPVAGVAVATGGKGEPALAASGPEVELYLGVGVRVGSRFKMTTRWIDVPEVVELKPHAKVVNVNIRISPQTVRNRFG
jgi:hypothetical protein